MKIIKSVTNYENLFVDNNFKLVDGIDYKVQAIICGKTWGGYKGNQTIKATYGTEQKAFVSEASDLDELFWSFHLHNGGDFQSFWFVEFQMEWRIEGNDYFLSLCCYADDLPESIKHYFIDESKQDIDSYFDCRYDEWEED